MIRCALRIASTNAELWLQAAGNQRIIRELEIPMDVLERDPRGMAGPAHLGLAVTHVRDLLPPDVAPYLAEAPVVARRKLVDALRGAIEQCQAVGAKYASFGFGLDRFREDVEAGICARVGILRELLPVAEDADVTLCVPVRYPRSFPGSREWEHAANIVHETEHSRCALAVDFVEPDLPADFDMDDFLRSCCARLAVLRMHYESGGTAAGDRETVASRSECLRKNGFRGLLVLCPKVREDDAIPAACRRAGDLAAMYAARF